MDFKNKKILTNPFPLMISDISDDFLKKENQNLICNEILEIKRKENTEMVMGGRYKYSSNFFKKLKYCNHIFNFFNKESTYNFLFNELNNSLRKFVLKNNYTMFLDTITKKDKKINQFLPFLYKNKFYLEMDFSIAEKNYSREPHHDKHSRILSFLLYLNTTNIKSGGSLEIYKYKNDNNNFYERFPKKDDLELFTKIKPEFGKLIVFLSSPDSIHGVENFNSFQDEKRIFLYGSYSAFNNVKWTLNQ